jgi:hypothetical protein
MEITKDMVRDYATAVATAFGKQRQGPQQPFCSRCGPGRSLFSVLGQVLV